MKKKSFDDLVGKVCAITGGGGIIGTELAIGLGSAGVKLAILDLKKELADTAAKIVADNTGSECIGYECDVLSEESLIRAKGAVGSDLGKIDILINGAGGNSPKATTQDEFINPDKLGDINKNFYGLDKEGFKKVFDLNFIGTLLPSMILTQEMITTGGVILNISSMNSFRPLTKIPAYSAAKASINNFTEWLAVHLAKVNIRVNAIAPGFFLTNQNRFLLINEKNGKLTERGEKIISNTPMGRFGEPQDLIGVTLFLVSDLSKFITGVIVPVDGGFNAYSGV